MRDVDDARVKSKTLLYRRVGGLGDIVVHRMLFPVLSRHTELHFACPRQYHDIAASPFLAGLHDLDVERSQFNEVWDTSEICGRYDLQGGDWQRSDIWAAHCGYALDSHDLHFDLTEAELAWGRERTGGTLGVCPISASVRKDIPRDVLLPVLHALSAKGQRYTLIHTGSVYDLPAVSGNGFRELAALLAGCDRVLCCDSAHFHICGGLGIPTVAVFRMGADTGHLGDVVGRYYPHKVILQGEEACTVERILGAIGLG